MTTISLKTLERVEALRLKMFAAGFTIEQLHDGAPLTIGKYILIDGELDALMRPMIEAKCKRDRDAAKKELDQLGFSAE